MAGQYKIVKSQLPLIGGTAGHNLIAVLDENGKVIHELNGLATSADGKIKPIGYLPSDKLIVYNEKEAEGFYYQPNQKQTILFTGSYEQVMEKFNLGYQVGQAINDLELQYPFLGIGPTKGGWAENSNSVASTLLYGMGLEDPDLGWSLTPGEGDLLLPKEKIDEIIRLHQNKKVSSLENEQEQPHLAQALLAKYQSAIEAMDAGKPNPILETARANPAVQKIMERFDAEWESRQMIREYGESRYSLENMPERARDLHAQITDKLSAYVRENNLPYSREGLANSITALTAEAFGQKMTEIDHIAINGGKLMVKQDGRFIHDFAEVDAFQSRLTPERDSFQNIVQAEQKHEQEEQQREMERQMERSRGMAMIR